MVNPSSFMKSLKKWAWKHCKAVFEKILAFET